MKYTLCYYMRIKTKGIIKLDRINKNNFPKVTFGSSEIYDKENYI